MKYELLYKCEQCETFFMETMDEENLRKRFLMDVGDWSMDDITVAIFKRGLKFHECPNNWKSYGKVTAIRPVEE